MATTFTLTGPATVIGGTASVYTLTLDSAAGSTVSFVLSDTQAGTFLANPVTITAGLLTTTFSYTPPKTANATITLTAVASGGLVKTQTLLVTVNYAPVKTTALQIITEGLGVLRVKAIGENIDGTEALECLAILNRVLDGWRAESMFAYATDTLVGTIKAGSKTVTIGPSGDLPYPYRPTTIMPGSFYSIGGVDRGFNPMTQDQFSAIPFKNLASIGPGGVYYEPTLPNGTLYLFPQFSADTPLTLQVQTELTDFADLTTGYTLAPGQRKALVYSFAEEAQDVYTAQLSPSAMKTAMLARKTIRKLNTEVPQFSLPRQRGNIFAGWEY